MDANINTFFSELLKDDPEVEIDWVDEITWGKIQDPLLCDWHDFGINPPAYDETGKIVLIVYETGFVIPANSFDQGQMLAYMVYWGVRIRLWIKNLRQVAQLEGTLTPNERIIAQFTEDEMNRQGIEMLWV